jgi:excisionase family DNA binding protein
MLTTESEPRDYLAVKEAARLLRVSPSSIYRAVERGSLPAVRLSRAGVIRIPRSALEAKP